MFEAGEFYREINKRNKEKFIQFVSKKIEEENKKNGGVNLPEFIDAEQAYEDFKNAGCFDCYGYLKEVKA